MELGCLCHFGSMVKQPKQFRNESFRFKNRLTFLMMILVVVLEYPCF